MGIRPVRSALLALLLAGATAAQTSVVVILADDVGHGDVGPHDHDGDPATPEVTNTPELDALAAGGLAMTHFYAASPVCTPTRASVLTGQHPIRYGLTQVLAPGAPQGLPSSALTVAELLQAAGYATGAVGKWHLGDQPEHHPLNQGFESFFGVLYSNNQSPFYTLNGFEVASTEPDQALLTQAYTSAAVDFVEGAVAAGRPFFLYLAYTMPHFPVHVSPAFEGLTGRGLYADAVFEMDWSIGHLRARLAELGVEDDTLLIFTSDNGACDQVELQAHPGAAPSWVCGSNAPFSGHKGGFQEGGLRVPFVASWPGTLPAGATSTELASTLDLLPTIAAATGVSPPAVPLDGEDLLGSWLFGAERALQGVFFYQLKGGSSFGQRELAALRSGAWKLFFLQPAFVPGPLFDVVLDPTESLPLAAPGTKATLSDLGHAFHCGLDDPLEPPIPTTDLALGAAVSASSSVDCDTSTHAVDGQAGTWWEAAGEVEWLRVDLGAPHTVRQVELAWGDRPALAYSVEVSLDGLAWSTAAVETAGGGGTEVLWFTRVARHLRLACSASARGGYRLRALRVRGVMASALPPKPPLSGQ